MESAVVMMRMCGTVREKQDRHVCVDLRDPSRLKAAGVSMDGGWGRRRRRQWLEEVTWLAWDGMSGRGEFRDLHGSTAGLQKQAISGQDLYVWLLPQILGEPKLKAMVIAWGSMIVFNLPFFIYLFLNWNIISTSICVATFTLMCTLFTHMQHFEMFIIREDYEAFFSFFKISTCMHLQRHKLCTIQAAAVT